MLYASGADGVLKILDLNFEYKMKKISFKSIRVRMFVGMLGLIFILVLVVNAVVFRKYIGDMEKEVVSYADDTVQKIAENMAETIYSLEENMMYKITYSEMFSYQKDLQNAVAFSVEHKMQAFAELMKSNTLLIDTVYIRDKYNCLFYWNRAEASHDYVREFKKTEAGRYIEDHYETLKSQRGATIWRRFEDDPDHIYLIKTVLNQDSLVYEGILCAALDKNYLAEMEENLSFQMAVYDETGSLLYSSPSLYDAAQSWAGELSKAKPASRGNGYLNVYSTVDKKGWTITGFISQKEFLEGMMEMFGQLFWLELLFILLSAAMAAWLSKNMTVNISSLISSFRRIGHGEEVGDIQYVPGDETAYLCEQFNHMNHKLKDSITQMALDRTQKEKAEYNALLAQMNPHFLFNTLESINALAKLEGQKEISDSITKLAGLFRASLPGKGEEIPLAQELDYVRQYLELQKLVSGGKLEWEISAEDSLLSCRIPKLLLQPLVENAVIHGFSDMMETAMIILIVKASPMGLAVEIYDNGKGMEQTFIDTILRGEETEKYKNDRAHIGLCSIQRRIRYLYGEPYGLTITSSIREGTVVKVILPLLLLNT